MGGQQKKVSQRAKNEIMGFTVSHKPAGFDLMQNCDLPPPSKVFMGPDKSLILSLNRVYNIAGKEEEQHTGGSYKIESGGGDDERDDKMELLKVLQASQTRAREAEKKAAVLRKERDGLSMALVEEAMHLFAYRQQVRLLELQVLNLQQSLWHQQQPEGAVDGHDEEETSTVTWALALVLSLGIGVTTATWALACRYYL